MTHTRGEYMEVHVILTEILNLIDPLENVIVDVRIILEWLGEIKCERLDWINPLNAEFKSHLPFAGIIRSSLRKPTDDITRQALEWNPQGKRSRGRPKNTVLEEAKGVKKTWVEIKCIAKNRVQWRNLVDALCSSVEWWDYWLIDWLGAHHVLHISGIRVKLSQEWQSFVSILPYHLVL